MYIKLRGEVALQGQEVHGKRKPRTQGRVQAFEQISQMALIRVLIPGLEYTRSHLSELGLRSQKGALGVELRSFDCRQRILVSISYISFWDFP